MIMGKNGGGTDNRDPLFALRRIVDLEIVFPQFLLYEPADSFAYSCTVVDDARDRRRRDPQFPGDGNDAYRTAFSCHRQFFLPFLFSVTVP